MFLTLTVCRCVRVCGDPRVHVWLRAPQLPPLGGENRSTYLWGRVSSELGPMHSALSTAWHSVAAVIQQSVGATRALTSSYHLGGASPGSALPLCGGQKLLALAWHT